MALVGELSLGLVMVLGVALAALLLVPIDYRARGRIGEAGAALSVRLRWGFGLLSVSYHYREGAYLSVLGLRVRRLRRSRRGGDGEAKKDEGARGRGRRGLRWLLAHRRALWRAFLRLLSTLHLRGHARGVVGLSDPAHTAWVHAALGQLSERLPAGVVAVDTDWTDERLELSLSLGGWLWPLQLLAVVAGLLLRPQTWRALRAS